MSTFSIKEALSVGWEKTKKHFWFLLLVLLGSVLVNVIFSIPGSGQEANEFSFAVFVSGVLGWVAGVFVQIGITRISLKMLNDERGGIRDFLPTWKMFWSVVAASILFGLLIFVGLIPLIVGGIGFTFSGLSGDFSGSIGLLAVAAVICLAWIGYFTARYYFYGYLIVDKGLGPIQSLKEAARITRGQRWHLIGFWLALIGVGLLGAIVFLVGLLWALPTVMIATAWVYRKLSSGRTQEV